MSQSTKVSLSLFVPCKNEETNLVRCLESVPWVDEVFVVDSQSTDRTSSIAQGHGAKVVQFEYKGGWPKKKNWALENLPFSHEWVLILDADECLPPEAEEEIRKIVNNPDEKHAGYWINRRYFFFGAALKTCLLSKLEPSTFSAQTREVRKNYRSFHRQRRSRNPRACCGKGNHWKINFDHGSPRFPHH